jgi:4,4'-diaponeurosporenoate glycosyltransferase
VVRGDIVESFGFGKAFMTSNLPLNCYGGRGVISFRMYPNGFLSMVEGFSKGFGIGAKSTTLIGRLSIFCWIFAGVHLSIRLLQSVLAINTPELIVYASLDALFIVQIRWMLNRIGNFSFISALFFQLHLIFFIAVFMLSIIKTFIVRSVKWKGRNLFTKAG